MLVQPQLNHWNVQKAVSLVVLILPVMVPHLENVVILSSTMLAMMRKVKFIFKRNVLGIKNVQLIQVHGPILILKCLGIEKSVLRRYTYMPL